MKRAALRPTAALAARLTLRMLLVMWAVSLLTFFLVQLAPGDPAEMILSARSETPSPQKTAEMRHRLGLDRPLWRQYLSWLEGMAHLDLGKSYRSGEPVFGLVLGRLSATLRLALSTMLLLVCLSTLTGAACALLKDSWLDRLTRWLAILAMAVPNYWLGLLLIYLFGLKWGVLPIFGDQGAASLVLPSLALGLAAALFQGRMLRATLLEVLQQDHVRFARAKGLSRGRVLVGHVLGAALPPVLAMWGTSFGRLLGGAVLIETVFAWPGLGLLCVEAVINRDLPVVQGAVLFMAMAFVLSGFLADLCQALLDPKLARPGLPRRRFAA